VTQPALFRNFDMDTTQIVRGLERLFNQDSHRIVIWYDADREFTDVVDNLGLDSVTVIHLDKTPALAVKILLERTDPQGRYLLYMPFEEPRAEEDWLLDIRLYSGQFHADRASMLLAELGLERSQNLRAHLNNRLKFLNNKDRLARLSKLVTADDDETALDRKMIAVLVRAEQAEVFNIITTIYQDLFNQGNGLDGSPSAWDDLTKFGLADPFWQMIEAAFGYKEDKPRLRNLLIRLMVTDFAENLINIKKLPASLTPHVLPESFRANTVVCLNQWRDSVTRGRSYDNLSAAISQALSLSDILSDVCSDDLIDVMTFLDVEKRIAVELRDRIIQEGVVLNADEIRSVITRRQDGHWASTILPSNDDAPRKAFHAVYKALEAAANFAELMQVHQHDFMQNSARSLYDSYASDLYRFDQSYRHFCESAAEARSEGWDILKPLQDKMEDDYGNGFLTPFALAWGKCMEQELLTNWRIDGTTNQYKFFDRNVKPIIEPKGQKVFVIISDAFRYEAAEELTSELNGRYRFKAELTTQLSVLPSCTALGMAALLPHKELSYGPKGEVLTDGNSASGLDNRNKVLETYEGLAVAADDLLAMKREEGRAFIKNSKFIYIYHNTIDKIGDNAASEDETFQAVRSAINDVVKLVRHIMNSLNGTNVIITADHGFLFQNTPPDLTDKSILEDKPEGAVLTKKRYILGRGLYIPDNVYHGAILNTAKAKGDMEFWIPKGTNRFHFSGGAKFIHGGAMPQEVMVPVVAVRKLRDEAAEKTRISTVAVRILGSNHKITTNRHRFQLLQTEAVTERNKPATLQVGIYDGDTLVSNLETVTFDSSSNDMDDRMKWVSLVLKSQKYNKKQSYALILRNADDNIEQQRAEVTIDLAFQNDF
jgi:uncharacterized protein (TIGR02687 family)